ncbi:MAG: helix-turn-helix domain-containing protein [Muribaculaceae bacterium]|nr:helix-turn-helix domain-containing protein [Muribaculaceae bacterium]
MKKLPLVIFVFIMLGAVCSSVCNYRSTENRITRDVNNALKLTLAEMPTNVVNADTISCYRSHLTIAELKDTACIAMTAVSRAGRQETQMVAQANCGFMTVLMLSDQRASGALLLAGILWMMGSLWYMRRFKPELFAAGLSYGGIVFAADKFLTAKGDSIHFTPMQHSLMEMFMTTESHSLSKQEICDRLWPKKPDASDTLYTLIKRVKPILEANSNLKIESDRGKSYTLKLK